MNERDNASWAERKKKIAFDTIQKRIRLVFLLAKN